MRFFRKVLANINSASNLADGMFAVFKDFAAIFSHSEIIIYLIITYIYGM